MTLLKCKTSLHWAVGAAILAPLLVAAMGGWGARTQAGPQVGQACSILLYGPRWYFKRAGGWRFRQAPLRDIYSAACSAHRLATARCTYGNSENANLVRGDQFVANTAPANALAHERANEIPRKQKRHKRRQQAPYPPPLAQLPRHSGSNSFTAIVRITPFSAASSGTTMVISTSCIHGSPSTIVLKVNRNA